MLLIGGVFVCKFYCKIRTKHVMDRFSYFVPNGRVCSSSRFLHMFIATAISFVHAWKAYMKTVIP